MEARAGTHFVPLLMTPDKWLIHDTIAIGPFLNDRFKDYAVVPEAPLQRASCYILEDAFNHWLGRHRDMLFGYSERFFRDWETEPARWMAGDTVPETLGVLLDYLQRTYFKFAAANVAAGLAGDKYYEYDYGFGTTKARTQKRLNVARLHVQDELQGVDAAGHDRIQALYASCGILEYYLN